MPLIYLSVPWAVSIHTVTAFLYAGIPGRHFWLTAVMAARFLASAFAGGPALLIILALLVRKFSNLTGAEAIQAIGKIVTYAMFANVFLLGLEFFTAFYSNIPGHMHPFHYLYAGIDGHTKLRPPDVDVEYPCGGRARNSGIPHLRRNESILAFACVALFTSLWIDRVSG